MTGGSLSFLHTNTSEQELEELKQKWSDQLKQEGHEEHVRQEGHADQAKQEGHAKHEASINRRTSVGSAASDLDLHAAGSLRLGLGCWELVRRASRRLLESDYFDMFIAGIIILNSAQIGVEQAVRLKGESMSVCEVSEHIFLTIYIFELCVRFAASGLRCLEDHWVKFDSMLVVLGIATIWFLPLVTCQDCSGELDNVMILRAARLLRLARTLHLLVRLPVLWMMIRGLVSSSSTMFYTLITLVCVLYALGLVGVELITNNTLAHGPEADPEFEALVQDYFPDLGMTMLTLVQFVTMDSIGSVYRPLIRKDWRLLFYFLGAILTISIVLANLITAVVVNRAIEQADEDKEARKVLEVKRKKKIIKDMRRVFQRLDADGSGMLTWAELKNGPEADITILRSLLTLDNPLQIFKMLDVDNSGQISIDEFCDGIADAVTSDRNIEFRRMEKHLQNVKKSLKEVFEVSKENRKSLSRASTCSSDASPEVAPRWAHDLVAKMQEQVAQQVAQELQVLRLELTLCTGRSPIEGQSLRHSLTSDSAVCRDVVAAGGEVGYTSKQDSPMAAAGGVVAKERQKALRFVKAPPPLVPPEPLLVQDPVKDHGAPPVECRLLPRGCHPAAVREERKSPRSPRPGSSPAGGSTSAWRSACEQDGHDWHRV